MVWRGSLVALVTGLCCAADCDRSNVHLQLTIMSDMAAFDNGNTMSSSSFLRSAVLDWLSKFQLSACGYGVVEISNIVYGDISNPPKQQCVRVLTPLGLLPGQAFGDYHRWFNYKGDTHWARPTSLEGNFLSALRYAMRADGWLQGEVDESGRRIVQIILAIGDVAGTVGTDESELGDSNDCDNFDYPTMHAVSEDQKNFLPNGIFLFLGDRDYPTMVRDAVDAFNTETLPYFLNGARGSAYRLPFPFTASNGISDYISKIISDAVCGNVPANPPSGPPPPPRDRLPMTTTTSTTHPSRTLCPNMQSFADIHLQVVFALDMAAFDGKSPARNVGFIRFDILTAMEYIKEGFPTSDISLYLYSDKGVTNGKCADRRFDLIPSAEAVAQTSDLFTGAGWNTLWERQYESEGSLFSVYRYIARQGSWIRSDVDENGKKVVRVVMAYSDEVGEGGEDASQWIDDPNTCGDHDYPSQAALNVDAEHLGAYFFFIGDNDQPHPIRDTINHFNKEVFIRQLSGCAGRAEKMSPDGSHISQTWQMIKEAACGVAVSPVVI